MLASQEERLMQSPSGREIRVRPQIHTAASDVSNPVLLDVEAYKRIQTVWPSLPARGSASTTSPRRSGKAGWGEPGSAPRRLVSTVP
jgi:hypothetical protein